jgi:cell division FtsZ-interacting protein ZapD
MTENLIPIAFPLTPRMQSLIELRDALRCMQQAWQSQSPFLWLTASNDIHALLVGDRHKKPAIPNIISLFSSMQKHFKHLGEKHPEFEQKLVQACKEIAASAEKIRNSTSPSIDFLNADAWLTAYRDSIRKQDLLGHKLSLPQLIHPLWQSSEHAQQFYTIVEPMIQAIEHLNTMLHAHVPWQQHIAKAGYDQITLAAQDDIGLVIIGMPEQAVAQGIVPSCSGVRAVVRLRFSQWLPGKVEHDIKHNQPYALMAVPIS